MEIYRGISTMWLFIHCFQIKLELTHVEFCGGGKLEKNPWGKDENQQQNKLNLHMTPGRTPDNLVGGEHSHHYATPAPTPRYKKNQLSQSLTMNQSPHPIKKGFTLFFPVELLFIGCLQSSDLLQSLYSVFQTYSFNCLGPLLRVSRIHHKWLA